MESSHLASMGLETAPLWLEEDRLLVMFAKRRGLAQQRYAQFVDEGIKADSPWANLKGQVLLDDEVVSISQSLLSCINKARFLPSSGVMLSLGLKRYYEPPDAACCAFVSLYATVGGLPTATPDLQHWTVCLPYHAAPSVVSAYIQRPSPSDHKVGFSNSFTRATCRFTCVAA